MIISALAASYENENMSVAVTGTVIYIRRSYSFPSHCRHSAHLLNRKVPIIMHHASCTVSAHQVSLLDIFYVYNRKDVIRNSTYYIIHPIVS